MSKYSDAAERIVSGYLNTSPKERLFIITDRNTGFPYGLSRACYLYSEKQGIDVQMIKQKQMSYGLADPRVINVLKNIKKNDCLFICLDGKIGTVFKTFNKGLRNHMRSRGARFATMVGLSSLTSEDVFLRALSIDTKPIRSIGNKLKKILDNGSEIEIHGNSGTSLRASIEGRKAWFNSGDFSRPGNGGNLPAGHVSISPVEESVEGSMEIDINTKIEADTVKTKTPIHIIVEKGEIVNIQGEKSITERMYNDLNNFSFINARHGFDSRAIFRIAEFGFGLLPEKPIGLTLLDDKVLGVCYIANGNNFGKGGKNKCRGHRESLFWLNHFKVDGEKFTPAKILKL